MTKRAIHDKTVFNLLCFALNGTRRIRTLDNSALVNSDPILFGPGQFGPRPLVNSDLFVMVNSDLIRYFSLVNSDLISDQFGPFSLVNSDLTSGQFGKFLLVSSDLTSCRFHQ